MKLRLTILTIGLFSLFGCGPKSNLTPIETDVVKKISFKAGLISELKDLTKSEIKQLPMIDQETGDIVGNKYFDGVYSETTEDKAVEYVRRLKTKFRENGYLIFTSEGEDNKSNVAVIKGTDDLDILRYRRTDGINHGLENEDIVNKISEWKSKYGLIVIGCSRDWLEVEFDNMPTNLDEFAKEVYEFCPDAVDQGTETVDKLKEVIIEMRGVWLWWD